LCRGGVILFSAAPEPGWCRLLASCMMALSYNV
jgi:hypothetical protein